MSACPVRSGAGAGDHPADGRAPGRAPRRRRRALSPSPSCSPRTPPSSSGASSPSTRRTGSSTPSGASATTTSSTCSAQGVRERQLWWTGAPYADVVDAVRRIKAHEHSIHVVTARDVRGIEAEAFDATEHWLARARAGGRHDQPRPGQDAGARPTRARPALVRRGRRRPAVHRLVQRRRGVRHRARPLGQLPRVAAVGARSHGGRRLDRRVDAATRRPAACGGGRRWRRWRWSQP